MLSSVWSCTNNNKLSLSPLNDNSVNCIHKRTTLFRTVYTVGLRYAANYTYKLDTDIDTDIDLLFYFIVY